MSSAAAPAASPLSIKASPRPGSRVALEVAIPGGRSQASYDAAVDKLSRSIKLPGFRKGKVPRPVLLQQIGPLRIRATALEDLVDAAFRDAVSQEMVAAIGRPELTEGFEVVMERFEPGSALTITLELDVEPPPTAPAPPCLRLRTEDEVVSRVSWDRRCVLATQRGMLD